MSQTAVLLPFLVFCMLMTGTPGPNNAMALASGARVGFRRSMPLVGGIALGVALQLVAVGAGLGAAFRLVPELHEIMRVAGSACLLWLACRIARSGPLRFDGGERPPLGFAGAVVFQWINPKAWVITTSAAATYIPPQHYLLNIGMAAIVIALVAFPCVSAWVAGGTLLRRFLAHPLHAHIFNAVVAVLLVATTFAMLFSGKGL